MIKIVCTYWNNDRVSCYQFRRGTCFFKLGKLCNGMPSQPIKEPYILKRKMLWDYLSWNFLLSLYFHFFVWKTVTHNLVALNILISSSMNLLPFLLMHDNGGNFIDFIFFRLLLYFDCTWHSDILLVKPYNMFENMTSTKPY